MIRELFEDANQRMHGAINSLEDDLAAFRTGRASPRLLDRLVVEVYGVETSLKQLASVSVPEPQQLAIRPFDPNSVGAIERAILKSDLGLTPNNDGKIIRLNIPPLTEERRRDLSRLVGNRVEEAKVAIRNVRRDIRDELDLYKEEGEISEDEYFRQQDNLQELTDTYGKKIDEVGKQKQDEIMEV